MEHPTRSPRRSQILLRLSPELNDRVRALAAAEYRSLNSQVIVMLQQALAQNEREKENA
jgi:hypothetical protein